MDLFWSDSFRHWQSESNHHASPVVGRVGTSENGNILAMQYQQHSLNAGWYKQANLTSIFSTR